MRPHLFYFFTRMVVSQNTALDEFVADLAACVPSGNLYNPYGYACAPNSVRRANLRLYLRQMVRKRPSVLLVGEAPGYRGCRLTGVPFTSEHLLLQGIAGMGLLGAARGYGKTAETQRPTREATATIAWGTFAACRQTPLLWNALPFHPHRAGEPFSNRTPAQREVACGEPFVRALLQIFAIREVVAVGNKAETALRAWDIAHHKVRHPSHGGKRAFETGITAVLGVATSR